MRLRILLGATIVLLAGAGPALARVPRLASDVEVHAVDFRFEGPHVLGAQDLVSSVATSAPGSFDRVKSALHWVPFVPEASPHPFSPVVLQQDLVRLRRRYRSQGFLEASVAYDIKASSDRQRVDVTFRVREGPALLTRSIALADSGGRPETALPDSLRQAWSSAWERLRARHVGRRFSEDEIEAQRAQIDLALANHGYPFATIEPRAVIDSVNHAADLVWIVRSGARARIAGIEVEGVTSVPPSLVTRQLGLHPGAWVARRDMERARMLLQSVPLFQRSQISLAPAAPGDSAGDAAVPVRVQVRESRPRVTNLEAGYVTDGAGVTGQTRWTHPNAFGGARSFDAIGLIQTGWGSTSDIPDKLLRATLTATQPYVASPALSLSLGPAFELRDGRLDRSGAWSILTTLVYRINALQSAALRYDYTYRKLRELRIPGLTSEQATRVLQAVFQSQSIIDSLTVPVRIGQVIFFTSLGHLDDIARPRHGFVLKPNLAVTVPPALSNVQFGRADAQLTYFRPFPGRDNALMLRGSLGGLWPFGASIPGPGESPTLSWYRMRDEVLTAGGATDVRGYQSQLLGPKFPVIEPDVVSGDTVYHSDHYAALGGLRRFTASAELRLGMPWFGRDVFGHLFADAGRVWTSDSRFQFGGLLVSDEDRVFYTTGGGVGYYTPVGAIRFDLGYKLNPSTYDLRDPQRVVDALRSGLPPSVAPVNETRRIVVHLSLGLFF